MPDASVTISLSDWTAAVAARTELEREIARLKTQNAIEVAKLVDANLNRIVGHAIPLVKFAMAHLSPEAVHGWPRRDLEAFVQLLSDRPLESLWESMDEQSWCADARDFAAEAEIWDSKRDRARLRPLPPAAVAYLAHPVGQDPDRADNLERARRWIKYLVDTTDHAICAPWLPYCQTLDESTYRPRGMRDNMATLRKCDLLIAVGGAISPGMRDEIDLMTTLGRPVIDLTHLGAEPPAMVPIS